MKRQTGVELNRIEPADRKGAGGAEPGTVPPTAQLSQQQRMIYDCLQGEAGGLTRRQIALRVSCSAPAVDEALGGLVSLSLVARLNTLVPSYMCKDPGSQVQARRE